MEPSESAPISPVLTSSLPLRAAGYWEIPPNNYKWYSEEEKYKPVVQADGGILSSAGAAILK